jgi:hypothetical protein
MAVPLVARTGLLSGCSTDLRPDERVASGVETTDPLETGSHDLPVSSDLEAYLLSGWGQSAPSGVRPLAPPELCAARRARLSRLLPGERIVIPAGHGARRGNGQEVRFRAASEYVYLTGHEAAGAVLVLEPDGGAHAATLYLEPPSGRAGLGFYTDNLRGELWVGPRPSLDDIAAALELEVRPLPAPPQRSRRRRAFSAASTRSSTRGLRQSMRSPTKSFERFSPSFVS